MSAVSRYGDWQVVPRPPACGAGACRRWLVERPGAGPDDLPDRFRVDPRTPVDTRVGWILRLIEQGADDGALDGVASVCERHCADPGSPRSVAQTLLDVQNALVSYVPDEDGEEIFQSAQFSYFARTGDCEDKSIFFAAVARRLGLEADAVWINQKGAANNHVTARVCLVHRRGAARFDGGRPWDDPDPGRVRVVGLAPPARCSYAWAEPTLRGALVGENPYDVLRRLGTGSPSRQHL